METLITVFHRYAGKEGNSTTLSRKELRQLMEAELSSFLKVLQTTPLVPLSLFFLITTLSPYSLSESCTLISGSNIFATHFPLYQAFSVSNLFVSLQSQKDPATVDKIMKDLDTNGDGEVNFEEFVSLVVGLSIACEQCYQMHLKGKK